MQTAPDAYATFLLPLPKNQLCRTYTGHRGRFSLEGPQMSTNDQYQVVLDEGNRIIIPHGGFSSFTKISVVLQNSFQTH